ncbi:putative dehydrogenase [Bacillus sp. TS-2]|nr:putative dehydrogenase [Bacillus sp. TS-2]
MKTKYAICGLSGRALGMFAKPIIDDFSFNSEIVGILDHDELRFEVFRERFPEHHHVQSYQEHQFEKMIQETNPDVIIVAGRDDTHAKYIISALEHNLDVISEKPMATRGSDCRAIIEAEKKSKGKVTVTFNYRYTPIHTKIKELILDGKIGRVTSIDLNWYLDTHHGSSYFKRWNRNRDLSGGLSIHKSTHHFDLVNWWIDQVPEEVFAYGALNYYGSEGELNPSKKDGRHCGTCLETEDCEYYSRWNNRLKRAKVEDEHLVMLEGKQGDFPYSEYRPDQCIFDSEINIEDTYTATVKYKKGALLSYSVNFSLPYEGYRLAINGTKGRIETLEYHAPKRAPFPTPVQTIDYYPLFGSKEIIHVVHREGGHGGGDPLLLEDIFLGESHNKPYQRLSGARDGAYSVAVGEAVWKSAHKNRPITIEEVLSMEKASVRHE